MNTTRIVLIVGILLSIALSSCTSSIQQSNVDDTKPKIIAPLATTRPTTEPIQPVDLSAKPKSIAPLPPARPTTEPIQPTDLSIKPKCIYPPLAVTPNPA